MLALTHHTIVKIAALRVGVKNFNAYALLGDDIVIANEAVAKSYHSLMTEVLGVSINLSKSLVSRNSFEFAKQLVLVDGNVTPVGAKNLLVAIKTVSGIPSILIDLVNKGVAFDEVQISDMFKSVPLVRKSQWKRLE